MDMKDRWRLRRVLVATDLTEVSERVVHTAAALAIRAQAELHVVHVLDLPSPSDRKPVDESGQAQIEQAERAVRDQAQRCLPQGGTVASHAVVVDAAYRGIVKQAVQVSADLIVVGPHSGGALQARVLGTTAERVIRRAGIPCLVVRGEVVLPIHQIGVPIDFAAPAYGALDVALAMGAALGERTSGEEPGEHLHVVYVGWWVEREDNPAYEHRVIRPELEWAVETALRRAGNGFRPEVQIEVRWANEPIEPLLRWAEEHAVEVLVMGTHGPTRLKRALLGSTASAVARKASCPVLFVPPSLWGLEDTETEVPEVNLQRVMIGMDFAEPSVAAMRWTARHLASEAELVLVHVIDVPEPPGPLKGQFASTDELVKTAQQGARQRLETLRGSQPFLHGRLDVREGKPAEEIARAAEELEADLIVVGEHGRRAGLWDLLGSTAERLLHTAPVPVLLAHGMPVDQPHHVLVAVDESDLTRHLLAWARWLRDRFGAHITVLHVLETMPYGYLEPLWIVEKEKATAAGAYREEAPWLIEYLRRAGLDGEDVMPRIVVGDPRLEIPAAAARFGTDLLVLGRRGKGGARRLLMGGVARAVLRSAPCPVLVVVDPSDTRSAARE